MAALFVTCPQKLPLKICSPSSTGMLHSSEMPSRSARRHCSSVPWRAPKVERPWRFQGGLPTKTRVQLMDTAGRGDGSASETWQGVALTSPGFSGRDCVRPSTSTSLSAHSRGDGGAHPRRKTGRADGRAIEAIVGAVLSAAPRTKQVRAHDRCAALREASELPGPERSCGSLWQTIFQERQSSRLLCWI